MPFSRPGFNGSEFNDFRKPHYEEHDTRPTDPAEEEASKQLGEIAAFLKNNFPRQASQGRRIADIVIELLKT